VDDDSAEYPAQASRTSSSGSGPRRSRRATTLAALAADLAVAALLAAACAGGSGAAGSNSSSPKPLAQVLDAFVQCLHKHGEPGTYITRAPSSPNSSTVLLIFHGYAIDGADVTSPQFQSAMQPCQHLIQIGTPPSAAELHQQLENGVKAASCMHAHGYPNWPDPKVIDGRLMNSIPSGLDLNSTQLQAAAKACGAGPL
jgi:hypothetical protein